MIWKVRQFLVDNGFSLKYGFMGLELMEPVALIRFHDASIIVPNRDCKRFAILGIEGRDFTLVAHAILTCEMCGGRTGPFIDHNNGRCPHYRCFDCDLKRMQMEETEKIRIYTRHLDKCELCRCYSKTKYLNNCPIPIFPEEMPRTKSGNLRSIQFKHYSVCKDCVPLVKDLSRKFKEVIQNEDLIKQLRKEIRDGKRNKVEQRS